jgi:hypothetical protein
MLGEDGWLCGACWQQEAAPTRQRVTAPAWKVAPDDVAAFLSGYRELRAKGVGEHAFDVQYRTGFWRPAVDVEDEPG